MNLEELRKIGEPQQAEGFPHIWSVRHQGEQKATVYDELSGDSVEIDTSNRADAMGELEAFLAAHDPKGRAMREMGKARDVERLHEVSDEVDEEEDLTFETFDPDAPVEAPDSREAFSDDDLDTDPYLEALFEDDETGGEL